MKRPQGFDSPRGAAQSPQASSPVARGRQTPGIAPTPATSRGASRPERSAPDSAPAEQSVRSARAELRRTRRERVAFERSEVRRFTRHARTRRRVAVAAVVTVVALVGGIAAIVFSPALELRTITIVGASQTDEAALHAAVDHQLGTPLALVDFAALTDDLSRFPRIRSYTTESVPPHTLVLTIVERQSIGVVPDGTGFAVVDPAGVVLESTSARPEGLPLISAGEASIGNPAFASVVDVLLALPPELLARVDSIAASTKDDVSFVLGGDTQSVIWGSVDRSVLKARVLAEILATHEATARLEYDVSAPEAVVVRPR
jgi:cell division protein FtsQ